MNESQRDSALAWVRRHPWGREAHLSADGVLFGCTTIAGDIEGLCRLATFNFSDLHEVAAWAGYGEAVPRVEREDTTAADQRGAQTP